MTYSVSWDVSGSDPGVTDAELSGDDFAKGDTIFCTVTPSDDEVSGDSVSSNTVSVDNTAPSIDSVSITPDPAVAADTLSCSYEGYADADGDADASTYEWDVDGTVVGTDPTLEGVFVGGQVATCTVTPFDGSEAGLALSASITIDNTAPVLDEVTLSPDPAYEGDTLVCAAGTATDADGESVSTTYVWSVDGLDPGETTAALSSDDFDRDQEVFCTVTPSDGTDDGDAVASNTVTIGNTAPLVSDVLISPSAATTSDELSCSYLFSDVDGDADESTIEWDVDGVVVGTDATLSSGYVGGSAVTCTVTAHDGTDEGNTDSDSLIIDNTPPVLTDVDLSPEPAFEGDTLTCTPGDVEDADGTTSFTYSYAWTVDGSDPGESTETLSSDYFDRDQEVLCYVTPNDGTDDGTEFSSNAVTIENTAPSIDSVSITPEPATASDVLTCSYSGFADVDGDADASSLTWSINGTEVSTGTILSTGYLGGDTITCTVTPDDGTDLGTALSYSLVITNTAPELSSVSLTPTTAYEGDTLTCTPGTATDEDGDTVSYSTAWSVAGADPGVTADTLDSSYFDRDQDVFCTVTPSDGSEDGLAVDSNTVTISNTAPSIASVSVSPAPATASDTLSCSYTGFSDADDDSDASTLSWTVNGSSVSTDSTLEGTFVGGDVVACTVTPDDGTDTGTAVSASVTIDNTAPVLDAVTLSPDPAYEGDTLTCTPGTATDADGSSVSYSYSWLVDGVDSGTTGSTLSSTYFDRDQPVHCTVTPSDGTDDGDAVASNTVTISNTAPSITSVTVSPSSPAVTDELSCSYSGYSDVDSDSDASTYSWTIAGTEVGTAATLSSGYQAGDEVTCTVTAFDGTDSGTALSDSVTIENTAPEISSVTLSPSTVYTDDTITATVSSSDADEDTVSLSYAWYVGGSLVAETGSTLDGSSYFDKADEVYVVVTPNDGTEDGAALSSDTVTVVNTAPSIASVSVTPSDATVTDTLSCSYSGFADADGDSDASTYSWTIGGTEVGTSATLSSGYEAGDEVTCTVTPYDGEEIGTALSDTVTIGNIPPVATAVTLTPSRVYTNDTLTASVTTDDDDGDTVSLSYAWYVNSTLLAVTGSSLDGSTYFDRGDEIYVVVTPNDGTDDGDSLTSSTTTVSNTAPSIDSVSVTPASPTVTDTLSCSYAGFADDDDDSDSSSYSWTISGTEVGTSSTLSSGYQSGDSVTCTVTPNDGTDTGTALSASVTIANTPPEVTAVTLSPSTVYTNDTITATVSTSDDDSDPVSLSYAWYVDGSLVGATGSTLSGSTYFDKNEDVYVVVTPNDGTEDGTALASDAVTVSNTAPTVSGVSLDPDPAYAEDVLLCTYTFADDDSDSDSSTYSWTIDGTEVGTSATLSGAFVFEDVVTCTITPNDGDEDGSAASASVTIGNTAPVLSEVTLSPDPAYESDTLTCTPGDITDADGTVGFDTTYAWEVNGVDIGESGDTLDGSSFDRDDEVVCIVTPGDGDDEGDAVSSNTVTISNTAPSIDSVSISPASPRPTDTLTCSYSGLR